MSAAAAANVTLAAAPAASSAAPLRILCLHGFFQSAPIFRMKTAALRKVLKNVASLEYIQAPHALSDADQFRNKPADGVPPDCHFTWWRWNQGMTQYSGWQESVAHVCAQVVAHGPYDAYLGFSQGASFLALLAAVASYQRAAASDPNLRQGSAHARRMAELAQVDCSWLLGSAPSSSPPLLMFVSGFVPRVAHLRQLFPRPLPFDAPALAGPAAASSSAAPSSPPVDTFEYDQDIPLIDIPSLHIYGLTDGDVPAWESAALASSFLGSTSKTHAGGHIVPSNAEFGRAYKAFLQQRSGASLQSSPDV